MIISATISRYRLLAKTTVLLAKTTVLLAGATVALATAGCGPSVHVMRHGTIQPPRADDCEVRFATELDPQTVTLRYQLAGFWSRRISGEHRFVYAVEDGDLLIAQLRFHYER